MPQHLTLNPAIVQADVTVLAPAGVKEAGWEPSEDSAPAYRLSIERVMLPPTPENLQTLMQAAWQALLAHEDSWPFREPVDPEDVPDYYDVIKVLLVACCVAPSQTLVPGSSLLR